MIEGVKDARRGESLARAACLIGGAFDGLTLAPMLAPGLGAKVFRIAEFAPGPDYRYAMNVAASLMLAWTLLLFWSARRPLERATVLLLTGILICCLMAAGAQAVRSGFIPLAGMLPTLVAQLGLAVLFLVAYVRVKTRLRPPTTDS
jgi:hypothetical protein